jgi:hypothetical protein
MENELVPRQVAALERLEKRDPNALVVGWSKALRGPIIEYGTGERKILSPTGYPRKYKEELR